MNCMTWTARLKQVADGFGAIGGNCYHYHRPGMDFPCIVWAEEGGDRLAADGVTAEQAVSGTLDYFTPAEFDPMVDNIQKQFDRMGLCWALLSVQYEPETRLIHYEWTWEV